MSVTIANRIRSQLSDRRTAIEADAKAGPRVLYCRGYKPKRRTLAHSSASGFYQAEVVNGRALQRTNGRATISCSLPNQPRLRSIWLELTAIPEPSHVEVYFNTRLILKRNIRGSRRVKIRLPAASPSNQFAIRIDSGSPIPNLPRNPSDERRNIGICVGEIRVAKHWWLNVDVRYPLERLLQWRRLLTGKLRLT